MWASGSRHFLRKDTYYSVTTKMIVPNGKLSIRKRILNLRNKRRTRLFLNNVVAKSSRLGMKYNMNKITYRDINGVVKTFDPQDNFWYNA